MVTLVGFAFLFGILISRMGLPPMVGFLVAGFAYNFAGLEAPTSLQLVADLGVTLLLFSIGLKLKLKDLATSEVWGTSVLHIAVSTLFFALAIFAGQALFQIPIFDVSPVAVIAIAFALSFSSTVYAVKVLEDKGDMSALYVVDGTEFERITPALPRQRSPQNAAILPTRFMLSDCRITIIPG